MEGHSSPRHPQEVHHDRCACETAQRSSQGSCHLQGTLGHPLRRVLALQKRVSVCIGETRGEENPLARRTRTTAFCGRKPSSSLPGPPALRAEIRGKADRPAAAPGARPSRSPCAQQSSRSCSPLPSTPCDSARPPPAPPEGGPLPHRRDFGRPAQLRMLPPTRPKASRAPRSTPCPRGLHFPLFSLPSRWPGPSDPRAAPAGTMLTCPPESMLPQDGDRGPHPARRALPVLQRPPHTPLRPPPPVLESCFAGPSRPKRHHCSPRGHPPARAAPSSA